MEALALCPRGAGISGAWASGPGEAGLRGKVGCLLCGNPEEAEGVPLLRVQAFEERAFWCPLVLEFP